jgi:MbtH protein
MFDDDSRLFVVVVNHLNQMSIWFADDEPPSGWRPVGHSGTKADCVAYIDSHWHDLRPEHLRTGG